MREWEISGEKNREQEIYFFSFENISFIKDVTLAAASQIAHSQTVRSSPIDRILIGLRIMTWDDAIAGES